MLTTFLTTEQLRTFGALLFVAIIFLALDKPPR